MAVSLHDSADASRRQTSGRLLLHAAMILCALLSAPSDGQAAEDTPTRRVLLLQQSESVGPLRAKFEAAFTDALQSVRSGPIEVYTESIESQPLPDTGQARLFREYLKNKYAGRTIDVIVAHGTGPLIFARENRQLFGNPPIVTTLAATGFLDSEDDIIGLQGGFWIDKTISLAIQLLPDTRAVYVIDGTRENNGGMETEVRRQWNARYSHMNLVYLRDLPLADLVSRVAAIPQHSIVLFARQTIKTGSQDLDQFDGLADVLRASRVPVFTQIEDFLGHGVVGGSIWRYEADAGRMATMATLIANGTPARDIPSGRNTYLTMLDWRQLQRWGIPESRVPAGTRILFRPESFFHLYRGYVVGGLAVFIVQSGLIVGLLLQRVRRRRAEEEARTHAIRYRSVVDAQSELICRFLPDTTLTFVNDAYCRFWNKTRGELIGRKFTDLIPEPARDAVVDRIARLRQGVDSHEHPVSLPDGSEGWHHWINQAIVDERGRLIEFQGVGRDITDRKRAETALRTAQERNSAILRAIPDMMFVLGRDGTYVDYHVRDAAELFVPPEQFVGKSIREIMPPECAEMMMAGIERACATREPVVLEYELTVGELKYYEARIVPVDRDQVLSIVRDVSETRRALDLNRTLAGRLIVSQEEERQRIARELHDDVSHKIALLNIDVDRVAHQLQQSELRARLRSISAQVSEIAGNLHDLSYELHPARLQTLGLLESLRVLCSEFSHQRQLNVVFTSTHKEVPRPIDPAVSLCLYRITQEALHNVARHSGAADAYVHLSCESDGISLQVYDTGVGFEPHTSRHTGLGLVSMRERVGILNGKLAIHTAPGRGTHIAARIPLTQAQPLPQPQTQPQIDSVSQSA